MGVEVLASEVVQNGFSGTEHEKENGVVAEPIKFGSNGDDVVIPEVENAPDTTGPTNVADEWPAPKRTHSFYFIRYRPYDDPKIKARVDVADRELTRRNQRRSQLIDDLRAKKSERSEFINKLKELTSESRQYKEAADGRRKEMGPLQEALGQMRGSNNYGNRGAMICSSEEELNDAIYSLKYRIQHESIPLSEEKQLLREIKQLEGTREKVIANAATRTKIQESLGPKEDLQDKVKRITVDLNGVKKEQQAISAKIKALDEAKKAVDEEIKAIQDELTAVTEKREEAYQNIQELRRQNEGGNSGFYQNRDLLNKVKALCYKKDIQALEELAHTEVEKFMSSWCSSKAFRDDYEKRLLASLDNRQLSRDGRMRNPDEKPLVVVEAPKVPEPEVKPIVKRPKEDPKPAAQQDTVPAQKIEKEANGEPEDSKTTPKHDDIEPEEIYALEKSEVDVPKTKEMIREEEMAKSKQAVERKKKLAEKAAAKAAIRAQKEAEKKNKVLEKKLKKKAAASAPPTEANPEESAEVVGEEPAEPENAEASVEAPVTRPKNSKIRQRPRGKGPESLPKVILKRKKSTNYWVWAAPAIAVVLALVFAALGYRYLL